MKTTKLAPIQGTYIHGQEIFIEDGPHQGLCLQIVRCYENEWTLFIGRYAGKQFTPSANPYPPIRKDMPHCDHPKVIIRQQLKEVLGSLKHWSDWVEKNEKRKLK